MQVRTVEIWVGLFVATGFAALFLLAMQVSNLTTVTAGSSYLVKARFENIAGLKVRAPVTVAGVTVGRVTDISYDSDTYQAVVSMRIGSQYDKLPDDTSASVLTSGLVGEKYVGLEPGGDTEMLKNGSVIKLTQSSLVLENLIGKFLFNKASGGGK